MYILQYIVPCSTNADSLNHCRDINIHTITSHTCLQLQHSTQQQGCSLSLERLGLKAFFSNVSVSVSDSYVSFT